MSINCFGLENQFPETIRDVCKALVGKVVLLVFNGCCKECVEILGVRDDVCICKNRRGNIKFVKIECICEIISNCEDVFMRFLR